MVTDEVKFGHAKKALVGVDDDAVLIQAGEELTKVFFVLGWRGAGDKNIVYVGIYKRKSAKDRVDEALKSLGSVAEAKRHEQVLIESEWCEHGCLLDVVGLDRDLVEGSTRSIFDSTRQPASPVAKSSMCGTG